MLLPIFYYKIRNLKFNNPSNFDYKQNANPFGVRFLGMGFKRGILDVVMF
jgi:hypothetical protein